MAKKARAPLSKWCIEIIESTLAENEEFKPRREITKELDELKKECASLRADLRQKSIVLDRYEKELRRYRSAAFTQDDFKGQRAYDKELVAILKAGGSVDSYRLLEKLGIDPSESDLVKAVTTQLEELEAYGFIETDGRSWKWIG
jgi:hypothetical protein